VQAIVSRDSWWVAFGDQRLDHVVERVLAGNQQIAAALENIKAARQEEALVRAGSFPVLGLTGGLGKTRLFKTAAYSSSTVTSNSLEASVSYEVDLWGTLSSQTDAASWEARATRTGPRGADPEPRGLSRRPVLADRLLESTTRSQQ